MADLQIFQSQITYAISWFLIVKLFNWKYIKGQNNTRYITIAEIYLLNGFAYVWVVRL
jgi:hypothetical protein